MIRTPSPASFPSAPFRRRTALVASFAAIACIAAAHGQTKPASPPPPDAPKKLQTSPPKPPAAKDATTPPSAPMPSAPPPGPAPARPPMPGGGAAPAITPVADAPAPRLLWDKFLAACGGKEAIFGKGSRRTKGSIDIPAAGMKGTVETFAKAPNKVLVKTTMGQFGVIEQGFDGTNAWAKDQMTGPRLLDGPELESFKRDAAYDGPFGYLDAAKSSSTLGKATFDGKECWVVELKETLGGDLTCYLDAKDGFMRGMRMVTDSQMGKIPVEMVVADYTPFGAVKWPSKTLTRVMMQEFTSTIDEVSYEEIADSAFDPPADIKALIDAKKNAPAGGAKPPAGGAKPSATPKETTAPKTKEPTAPKSTDAPPKSADAPPSGR